ncbi:MAG: tyrosine-type recombinase/integrase [Candidatus Roizmanbacteria bacterium]|nr:tyrosine-type recombinase/integrase [Candidatus Roizmanbacteria bacterium]
MNGQDFERYISTKTSLSKNSIRHCLSRHKIFILWLKSHNTELNKESAEEFFYDLKQQGRNNNTLNTYVFALRQYHNYLKDRGVENDFFDGFKSFKKYRPPIFILTQEEVEKIINTNTLKKSRSDRLEWHQFILKTFRMFLAYTGCRYEEAASLPVKNLDITNGKVVLDHTKNGTSRNLYITTPLTTRLQKLIEGKEKTDFVFTNLRGKKLYAQDFSKDLRYAAQLAGVTKRVHPHLFRHTYGTNLYLATKDLGLVQLVLGHKDIKSTMIYIHIADEFVKKGMLRHPFIRSQVDPKVFINAVEEAIKNFKLDEDHRFDYLTVKNAINEFSSKLYESLKPQTQKYYQEINKDLAELKSLNSMNGSLNSFVEFKKIFSKIVARLVDCDSKTIKLKNFIVNNKRVLIDIINLND